MNNQDIFPNMVFVIFGGMYITVEKCLLILKEVNDHDSWLKKELGGCMDRTN